MSIHEDAQQVIAAALKDALPDSAVRKALKSLPVCSGKLILTAVGKAAWQMADAAWKELGGKVDKGIVITKHGHSRGPIGNLTICEAGHPFPDADSYEATRQAIELVSDLDKDDLVLFLISGGGSALFEKPLIPEEEMNDITGQLLSKGVDIVEMNTIRKRLSAVKGGKFARLCSPAQVYSIVLSDIIGDPLDMIASGPAYPDSSTPEQAEEIVKKYQLQLSEEACKLLRQDSVTRLDNVQTVVTGSVRQLCASAAECCTKLGYEPVVLTAELCCEAREAGSFFASIARYHDKTNRKMAFIAGGETIVHLTGKGLGGRNQEIALAAAKGLEGLEHALLFSVGSDGTDGPTDAAGGIVDTQTAAKMRQAGFRIDDVLKENDAYHALKAADALILTGPTGTNVNDLTCLLIG